MAVWTREQIELLRKLWNEGLAGTEIAKAIPGGFTRNAVIGKAHRIGLGLKEARVAGRPIAPPRRPRRATRAVVCAPRHNPKPAKVSPGDELARIRALQPVAVEGDAPRTALTLRFIGECKFGIGDPRADAHFAFCGRATDGLQVYCADHRKLVYDKPPKSNAGGDVARVRKMLDERDRRRIRRGAFGVGTTDAREVGF